MGRQFADELVGEAAGVARRVETVRLLAALQGAGGQSRLPEHECLGPFLPARLPFHAFA